MADIRVSDVKQMSDAYLDAYLAEHAMGWRLRTTARGTLADTEDGAVCVSGVSLCRKWNPSADPAASAQLRERMIHVVENFRRLEIHILQPGEGVAAQIAVGTSDVDEHYPFYASAETECRAVAEAAFFALEGNR